MSANLVVVPAPTVKVAAKQYSVRYGHGAIYLLSLWGVDMSRIFQTLLEALGREADGDSPAIPPNGHRVELMAKIAAAGLGTVDQDGLWRSAAMTPQDVMDRLLDDEAEVLDRVTWTAFAKKIGLPLTPKSEQPAAQTDPNLIPNSGGSISGPSESEASA